MNPRPITDADLADPDKAGMTRITMHAPEGMENCLDVDVLIGDGVTLVPFTPDEIEVAQLAHGGTLWLVLHTLRMPPVALVVEETPS